MKLIINSKHFNDVLVSIVKISFVDQISFSYLSLYFFYVILPLFISYDLIFEGSKMTGKLKVSWFVQH